MKTKFKKLAIAVGVALISTGVLAGSPGQEGNTGSKGKQAQCEKALNGVIAQEKIETKVEAPSTRGAEGN